MLSSKTAKITRYFDVSNMEWIMHTIAFLLHYAKALHKYNYNS